jgi:hypothetical protein
MKPIDINKLLDKNTETLSALFSQHADDWCDKSPQGKWTAGQHIIHLVQSTAPLVKAMSYPGFLLKWKFGKSNRPCRDFGTVVERYKEKLGNVPSGMTSPFSKNMPSVTTAAELQEWISKLISLNEKLKAKTLKKSDNDLDTILLPHPLMGRMTLREILMWNAYHTEHHFDILNTKYKNL